jgi:hypothetical protein
MNLNSRPTPTFPTADELMAKVLDHVTKTTNLVIGETMAGPVAIVFDGKMHDPATAQIGAVMQGVDYQTLSNVRPVEKGEEVQVVTLKFQWDAIDQLDFSKVPSGSKFLYPYTMSIPHQDVLPQLVVGSEITVMDPSTFMPVIGTVTQSTIDSLKFGLFRFALGTK